MGENPSSFRGLAPEAPRREGAHSSSSSVDHEAPRPRQYALVRPSGTIERGSASTLDPSTAGHLLDANLLAEWPIGERLVALAGADGRLGPTGADPEPARVSGHPVTGWLLVVGARRSDDTWNGLTDADLVRLRSATDLPARRPREPLHPAIVVAERREAAPPALWPGSVAAIVAAAEARHRDRSRRR